MNTGRMRSTRLKSPIFTRSSGQAVCGANESLRVLNAAKSPQDVAFGGQVQAPIIDPPCVGEHQIIIFHLLRPPIAGTMVALRLRMGRHIGQRCVAIARFVPPLHRQVVVTGDPPPLLAAVAQPVVERGIDESWTKRVADAERSRAGGIEVLGKDSEASLNR